MPYNPSVNDRSGEILAGYQTRSSEITAAGNQALASGIMQGATSAIGGGLGAATGFNTAGMIKDASGNSIPGLGDALDSVKANAIKYNEAAGMLDAYKQNAGALGLDMQMLDGVADKYKNKPNELLGHLTVIGSIANNNLSMQRQTAQIEGYKDLADYKSANTPAAATTQPKMNSESIRSMVAEAKQAGFTDDAIKTKLGQQFGDWAVRSVYPPQNQGIWMGQ
jgi:hypothetical protein